MDMFDAAVGEQQPVLDTPILFSGANPIEMPLQGSTIVGMGASQHEIDGRWNVRILLEDAEGFVGPADPSAGNVPTEASGMAQLLRLGEVSFAPAQGILGLLAVFDVGVAAVPFDDVATFVAKRRGAVEEPAIHAVRQ